MTCAALSVPSSIALLILRRIPPFFDGFRGAWLQWPCIRIKPNTAIGTYGSRGVAAEAIVRIAGARSAASLLSGSQGKRSWGFGRAESGRRSQLL